MYIEDIPPPEFGSMRYGLFKAHKLSYKQQFDLSPLPS